MTVMIVVMQFIDTHAHLDFSDDIDGWIERAKSAGVNKIICVGTSVDASRKGVEIAQQRRTGTQIYATVGIHAEDGKSDIEKYGSLENCIGELRQIVRENDKVMVGVGECGFDFKESRVKSLELSNEEKKFQKELFEAQIELAEDLNLPLVVHCRNAFEETFELLQGRTLTGVFHSWTGDWKDAQKALELGFYISFSGIVTFKQSLRSSSLEKLGTAGLRNAPNVQEVAKRMAIERMLLETDSPFLAPEPLRGKTNEPKNVRIVAEFVAELRNLPVSEIAKITSKNAERLFKIEN